MGQHDTKTQYTHAWRIVQRFRAPIRQQGALILGSMLALLLEIGLRLLEPWPLKVILDYVLHGRPADSSAGPVLGQLTPQGLLMASVLGTVIIAGLRALAAYWNTVGFALVGNRVLTAVRSDLYRHLQRLSLSFHTKARNGDLTVRVISDVGLLQEVTVTALLPLLANTLVLVGMLGVMFWLNAQLALLALVTVPLFGLTTLRLGRRIRAVGRQQRQREGAMAATVAESISAIKVVQALSLEARFAETFANQSQKSLREGVKATRLAASLERSVDVLIALATALVLWYGAQLVLRHALTSGDLIVFLTYLRNAFRPVRDFAKYTGRIAKATAAGERVLELLDQEPDVRDLPGARPAPPLHGVVRFDGVSFGYEPGRHVLQDINFTVAPGQRVALVGPSGNGKSTLVHLVMRLYDPSKGRVMIDGCDIREYTLDSLRSQISVVMQDSLLFAATVRDNIAYGILEATQEDVEAAARLANAHDFIVALPQGYDTVLGERGVTLSSGQRQRIAIARAAIRQSPILILDEPTTGLDETNERVVLEALERLAQGRTTFHITHNMTHAARAAFVVCLEDGHLRELDTRGGALRLAPGGDASTVHREAYALTLGC